MCFNRRRQRGLEARPDDSSESGTASGDIKGSNGVEQKVGPVDEKDLQ
jgi:hypothetical protein